MKAAAVTLAAVCLALAAFAWFERAGALAEAAQARTEASAAREELSALRASLERSDTIERAVDGDTVVLASLGKTRILGINTPELWEKTAKGGWIAKADPDPRACSARDWLRSLEGRRVVVQQEEAKKDRYGRALAHLYVLPDGPDVAMHVLAHGWASICAIPPNLARYKDWKAASRWTGAEPPAEE